MGGTLSVAGPVQSLLGGRVRLRQPAEGLGAGLDAVMLAASVAAPSGGVMLDAGCGAGAVFLCALARLPTLRAVAVERDPVLAALARENATLNGWADRVEVVEGDVTDPGLRPRLPACDMAVCNPPFWPGGSPPPRAIRAGATHAAATGLGTWAQLLAAALGRNGRAAMVLPAARLEEGLVAMRSAGLGGTEVLPLWPRAGRAAKRVLLRARRAPRAPNALLPGLVLHDAQGWTPAADAVLHGTGLDWGEG